MNENSTDSLYAYMADRVCARAFAGETACPWLVEPYYLHLSHAWHSTQVATKRTVMEHSVLSPEHFALHAKRAAVHDTLCGPFVLHRSASIVCELSEGYMV